MWHTEPTGLLVVAREQSHTLELFPPDAGQLRFWNPDDLNASPSASLPTPEWIEEKLQEVCEHLGITRDGHLNRKKLVSICEQFGLQNVSGEVSGRGAGVAGGVARTRRRAGCRCCPRGLPCGSSLFAPHKAQVQVNSSPLGRRRPARCFPRGFVGIEPLRGCAGPRQLPCTVMPVHRHVPSQGKLEIKKHTLDSKHDSLILGSIYLESKYWFQYSQIVAFDFAKTCRLSLSSRQSPRVNYFFSKMPP